QLQTETATPSRPRFVIEEVTTGSVLLCAIRREVAQISNAFDTQNADRKTASSSARPRSIKGSSDKD
ncbi:hypothetical protein, partial [Burkholderia contaminans]